MEIRNIRHKGLRNLVEKNMTKGLPPNCVVRISDIIAFLVAIEDIDEVFDLQKFKPHLLTGDRAGTFSFHITANWRITFRHDAGTNELYDLNYEDYH